MKKVIVELDPVWVLSHREDEPLPIDLVKGIVDIIDGVSVEESSYAELSLVFDENKTDASAIESKLKELLGYKYPGDNLSEILTIKISDCKESGESAEERPDLQTPGKVSEPDLTALKNSVDCLVGANEFKALVSELIKIAPELIRSNAQDVFLNQCYLFSIGDGCGLTTYLNILARAVDKLKLAKMSPRYVTECALGAYRDGAEPFSEVTRMLENGNGGAVRVLCIDISEWINRTDNRFFKQFLKTAEKHVEEFVIVFRVPFVDKDVLEGLRYSLSDLLSVRAISVPPLDASEIKQIAVNEIKQKGYGVANNAWQHFFRRISIEKSDGKFYGLNTVKKVVRELVYYKHLSNAEKVKKSKIITEKDMRTLCKGTAENASGEAQLCKLIGSEKIREKLDEIIAQIELSMREDTAERPCIHMRFVGNPGTGKTTVARIIGKILKEKGVLRVGNFFEYAGRDLCGRYVGETAPKTASICRDAYGSVLFIDEAYTLYRGDGDTKDYGREAIDTLIAEMENHKDDFVVIMAGYTDDMDKLMSGNLGLKSRMPYTLEFPNFTREQLYEIFASMVKGSFRYDDSLMATAEAYFKALPDEFINAKEFSNARFVRNLFERMWGKAAMRCQLAKKSKIVLTKDDFDRASAEKEFSLNAPKKTYIGF